MCVCIFKEHVRAGNDASGHYADSINAVICQTIAHSGSKFTIIQHKSPLITDQRVVQEKQQVVMDLPHLC